MDLEILVEAEISRLPWTSLRTATGTADHVPDALRSLLAAQSAREVQDAYWRLENHVVVQGQLFEAAVATTQVLMAALTALERPPFVRIGVLELLFQIVSGEAHALEAGRGLPDLGIICRNAAREGLWILYRELLQGEADAAKEVIELVEIDQNRLREIEHRTPRR